MVLPFGIVAGAVACRALSAVAMAQAKDPPSLQKLAKTHKNPFAQSVNVPFELPPASGWGQSAAPARA